MLAPLTIGDDRQKSVCMVACRLFLASDYALSLIHI